MQRCNDATYPDHEPLKCLGTYWESSWLLSHSLRLIKHVRYIIAYVHIYVYGICSPLLLASSSIKTCCQSNRYTNHSSISGISSRILYFLVSSHLYIINVYVPYYIIVSYHVHSDGTDNTRSMGLCMTHTHIHMCVYIYI